MLLDDSIGHVQLAAGSALAKLADHGEFVVVHYSDITNTGMKVEFRREIGTAIPSLVQLLESGNSAVQLAACSALVKLADHGEFVVLCYLDIANAVMKSSFSGQLGQPFHHSSRHSNTVTTTSDWLWFLHLPSWLTMVSL